VRTSPCKIFVLLLCSLLLGFEWEGRLSSLRRDLHDGDAARRREVVRLLASYPRDVAGDLLLQALSDDDAGVRAEAAEAVGRVRLQRAVPPLLDWLGDADADVRTSAAIALGRIGEPRAVSPLVRLLGDTRVDVRRAAVGALADIGTPDVVSPLLGRLDDADTGVRVEAAEALGQIGDTQALVPLIGRLRDDTPEVRRAVYAALGALGSPQAVPSLLPGLQDGTPEVRLAAIGALGRVGDAAVARALAPLVTDVDHRVARAAVAALGSLGGPAALDALVTALEKRETRESAASTLLHMARAAGSEEQQALVGRLTQALDRTSSDAMTTALAEVLLRLAERMPIEGAARALRHAMEAGRGHGGTLARALGATGSPDVLIPLLERLGSESQAAQVSALDGLTLLFDRIPPDGRAADPLLTAAGQLPSSALPKLVRLVGHLRADRAVPALRELLSHPSAGVRLAAVHALGAIGDPEAASALLPLLEDRDGRTRFEAARALQSAASPATVDALLERLTDRNPQDRHAILTALGGALRRLHGEDAVAPARAEVIRGRLAPLLRSPDRQLVARTIDALGLWGDGSNATLLIARTTRGPMALRRQALRALGALPGEAAVGALREGMSAEDRSLVAHAAGVLGEHGTAEDAQRLMALIREDRWPTAAAASFGLVRLLRRGVGAGGADAAALCAQLGRTRDPYVRANLAIALAVQDGAVCEGGPDPAELLAPRHASAVRVAAAHWLAAQGRAGNAPRAEAQLAQCADDDPAPSVARACAEPDLAPLTSRADVYAYAPDGSRLWTDRPVALRFADGTVWVVHSDLNGHVWLEGAADGALLLDDPVSTPLEP
jgi:cellulose synthase operon protein C